MAEEWRTIILPHRQSELPAPQRSWRRAGDLYAVMTVFSRVARADCSLDRSQKIDKSLPIVPEAELVADRRNSRLKSRAQISDGSGRRRFVVRRKVCAVRSTRYRGPERSSGS